jgi:hypothetical protein
MTEHVSLPEGSSHDLSVVAQDFKSLGSSVHWSLSVQQLLRCSLLSLVLMRMLRTLGRNANYITTTRI